MTTDYRSLEKKSFKKTFLVHAMLVSLLLYGFSVVPVSVIPNSLQVIVVILMMAICLYVGVEILLSNFIFSTKLNINRKTKLYIDYSEHFLVVGVFSLMASQYIELTIFHVVFAISYFNYLATHFAITLLFLKKRN